MKEHRLPIRRSARYYSLGSPNDNTRCMWIVLHGYGQLGKDFIKAFEGIDDGNTVVVAPEALSRFYVDGLTGKVGATWMTKEDRLAEIEDQRNYLDGLYRVATHLLPHEAIINVLGFSQGTATATRWVSKTKNKIDNLVLWAGDFPKDIEDYNKFSSMRTHLVYGTADPFLKIDRVRDIESMMQSKGIAFETHTFPGKHHLNTEILQTLNKQFTPAMGA